MLLNYFGKLFTYVSIKGNASNADYSITSITIKAVNFSFNSFFSINFDNLEARAPPNE